MAASGSETGSRNPSTALAAWQDALAHARKSFAGWTEDTKRTMAPFQTGADPSGEGMDDAITGAEIQLSSILDTLRAAHTQMVEVYASAVADQAPDTRQRLEWQRAEQTRTLRTQLAQMGDEGQAILTRAQASAARALFEAASREWNQPRNCRECGASIVVGAVWQPTTFTCANCNAKTTFEPAPLTDRFYTGQSLESICAEHALDSWLALRTAQRRFEAYTHPLPSDFEPVASAARAWATAHATLYGQLHPAWGPEDVAQASAKRASDALGEADSTNAATTRARFAEGAEVAAGGDLAKLMEWAQRHVSLSEMGSIVGDLAVCVHEHGDRTAAWQVIALQHHVQRVQQDRDSWMRDHLAELDAQLRLR